MSGALPQTVGFRMADLIDDWPGVADRSDSGITQTREGVQRWRFTATWPDLVRDEWAPIQAFLMAQRGPSGSFTVVPPQYATPRGALGGTPLVNVPAVQDDGFDGESPSPWTLGAGWVISGGAATHNPGSAGSISQSYDFTAGVTYEITFTVSNTTAGVVRVNLIGGTTVNGTNRAADGTYTEGLAALSGNNTLYFDCSSDFDGSIDDVSIAVVGNALPIDGASTGITNWLRAGDLLVLAGHTKVYLVTDDVDTDGSGVAAVPIEPPLVESPADGEALTLTDVPFTVGRVGPVTTFACRGPLLGASYQVELEERW